MNNLLNSGMVGVVEKTEAEIIKIWSSIGFLDIIDEEIKPKTAMLCEKMASIIIKTGNYYTYDGKIDTVIFPIIIRIVNEIYKTIEDKNRKFGMVQLLESEYILKRVSAMFDDAISFYEKHLTSSKMDIEAECVAWLSQLIAYEYIAGFSGKDIISVGEGKFEAVIILE